MDRRLPPRAAMQALTRLVLRLKRASHPNQRHRDNRVRNLNNNSLIIISSNNNSLCQCPTMSPRKAPTLLEEPWACTHVDQEVTHLNSLAVHNK